MSKKCPTPYKLSFDTKGDAMAALNRQSGEHGRIAVKVYRCPCGTWHLAGPRRPVSEEMRKRNHRRKGGPRWKRRARRKK